MSNLFLVTTPRCHRAEDGHGCAETPESVATPRHGGQQQRQQDFLSRLKDRLRETFPRLRAGSRSRSPVPMPPPVTLSEVKRRHRQWRHADCPACGDRMTSFMDTAWQFLDANKGGRTPLQQREVAQVNAWMDELRGVWSANKRIPQTHPVGRVLARLAARFSCCSPAVRKRRARARQVETIRERWLPGVMSPAVPLR
jgi:hypothetical protein